MSKLSMLNEKMVREGYAEVMYIPPLNLILARGKYELIWDKAYNILT